MQELDQLTFEATWHDCCSPKVRTLRVTVKDDPDAPYTQLCDSALEKAYEKAERILRKRGKGGEAEVIECVEV